jgi:ABC-type sugar transport system permease subunit
MPWLGRPFVGLDNYVAIARDTRFWSALAHTAFFAGTSITLEMLLGLALALGMNRAFRGRGAVRAAVLLPWAIPTVVVALIARFMFQSPWGVVDTLLVRSGLVEHAPVWLASPRLAWVPLVLADVWKTTPFVALLLLAGLQNIDAELYEAAASDGASSWWQLRRITLPLLAPALVVALIFRTLDAFRVFDLVYVLTGGGPGTATEPIALYTFNALLQNLEFGYGAALSMIVFVVTFTLALGYVRWLGRAEPASAVSAPRGARS